MSKYILEIEQGSELNQYILLYVNVNKEIYKT